jgi:hypothetical protein
MIFNPRLRFQPGHFIDSPQRCQEPAIQRKSIPPSDCTAPTPHTSMCLASSEPAKAANVILAEGKNDAGVLDITILDK